MVAIALPLADIASEGQDVVIGMLIVGIVILAVIGLGEFADYRTRKQK